MGDALRDFSILDKATSANRTTGKVSLVSKLGQENPNNPYNTAAHFKGRRNNALKTMHTSNPL
jgi:hypothetical protein